MCRELVGLWHQHIYIREYSAVHVLRSAYAARSMLNSQYVEQTYSVCKRR